MSKQKRKHGKRQKKEPHTYGKRIKYYSEHEVTLCFREPITTYPFKDTDQITVNILPEDVRGSLLYKLPGASGDRYKRMPDHVRRLIYMVLDEDGNDVTDIYEWVKKSALDEKQLLRTLEKLKFKLSLKR